MKILNCIYYLNVIHEIYFYNVVIIFPFLLILLSSLLYLYFIDLHIFKCIHMPKASHI